MPKSSFAVKLVYIFLIIILLAAQASADLNPGKNQRISSHFLKSEYQDSGQPRPQIAERYVEAVVYLEDADKVKLLENYASIEVISGNLVQVSATPGKLKEISELPFVSYVRKPKTSHTDVVNEGVTRMEAQRLHNLSIRGNGITIAVLDGGFQNYQSRLGTELPANVITRSFRADGDISAGEVHGTAVAEIVHDVAPDSQMYLVNFDTELEFKAAVDWLIQQPVDIITMSAGWVAGPFDGTGFLEDIVNNSINHGIVWINSAGNYAKQHWEGKFREFVDANGFSWNEFAGSDISQNINVQAGDIIDIAVSWDDWVRVDQDYDLYLFDRNGNIVALSDDPQSGRRGQEPVEELQYIATYTGAYEIRILKADATRDVTFELYSGDHELQYQVASSSLAIPSDVSRVIAVGATFWRDDSLEPFSSQGPTKDGRIKPDVAAPDGVSTATFGARSFFGTSASAPNVAGSAVLLMSVANLSVSEVKAALENGAVDLGPPGKDNLYGAGRVDVYKAYKQVVPPRIDILSTRGQIFNQNDTILILGSSNRGLEPLNLTINGTNYTLNLRATTRDDGSWGISWNTLNLFAGNYSINASISFASVSSSLVLVNRSLVLNITPSSLLIGVPESVKANVRDLTGAPVSGVEVTLRGDNFTITNATDKDGNSLFFVTAAGQLNATAAGIGYSGAAANITVKRLSGITLSLPFALLKINEVKNFTADGIDEDGFLHSIRAGWASSNISVGSIDSNGTLVAISAGTSNITATFGNSSASVNVTVGNASNGTLVRILPSSLSPNENFTITLSPSAPELFSEYTVVESIPFLPQSNSTLVITQVNGSNVTYNLTAPSLNGTYVFRGRFEDKNHDIGDISGAATLVVGNPVLRYDFNGNGRIDRSEAVQAVIDYFSGAITRQEAVKVVISYFSGSI